LSYLRSILILFIYLRLDIPSGLSILVFRLKCSMYSSYHPFVLYISITSLFLFHDSDNIL